jgi:hypothetical protein
MEKNFVARLISSAGFFRIEVPMSATFADFKQAITILVNVHPKEQKLFYDNQHKKALSYPDSTPVTKLGLK